MCSRSQNHLSGPSSSCNFFSSFVLYYIYIRKFDSITTHSILFLPWLPLQIKNIGVEVDAMYWGPPTLCMLYELFFLHARETNQISVAHHQPKINHYGPKYLMGFFLFSFSYLDQSFRWLLQASFIELIEYLELIKTKINLSHCSQHEQKKKNRSSY